MNRYQIKTAYGLRWLSVPLADFHLGQTIREVKINYGMDWRAYHMHVLKNEYRMAQHFDQASTIVQRTYRASPPLLFELAIQSINNVVDFLGLSPTQIMRSSELKVEGKGVQRILDIIKHLGADTYLCGYQGSCHYLDPRVLEENSIKVQYIDYASKRYPQQHGERFNPSVSVLDLIG